MDLISSGRLFQVVEAKTRKAREAVTVLFSAGLVEPCQMIMNASNLSVHDRRRALRDMLAGGVDVP